MFLQVRLVEQTGYPAACREVAINQPEFLIGRAAGCDLRLPLSAVSRHHCLIRLEGGHAMLTDLDSSNGTHVNGQRISEVVRLRPGDCLRIGPTQFLVEMNRSDTLAFGHSQTPDS